MKKICLTLTLMLILISPIVYANVPVRSSAPLPFHWGLILYKSMDLTYDEYILNGDQWGIEYIYNYYVIGLGRHTVRWEWDWDVYAENKTKHYTGTSGHNESIWTFRLIPPHIKLRAFKTIIKPFDLYDYGTVWARFYIDGKLVWNKTLFYDYWTWRLHPVMDN